MQTGIRQNRKRLFRQRIRSQVVRIVQYRIARQKNSYWLSLVVTSYQNCRQNRQGRGRIKNRIKGVSCTISIDCTKLNRLAYWKSAQNKDQHSDRLTYKLLGVYIHRNIKQAKRIMGSEDGLNNY